MESIIKFNDIKSTGNPAVSLYIPESDKNPEIIQEMIDKIDHDTLDSLLKVLYDGNDINPDVKAKYLRKWAYAKYEFYLMFGRKLSIEKNIDLKISRDDFNVLLKEALNKFPEYKILWCLITNTEFLNNRLEENEVLAKEFPDDFKVGKKVTRFLSGLCENKDLDVALSHVIGKTTYKGLIASSIDPCDFLTMSHNQHGWASCQTITGRSGSVYRSAALSLMLDGTTFIAYQHNGKMYDYELDGVSFSWNSKRFRQRVYLDRFSGTLGFHRTYPDNNQSDDVFVEFRKLMQEYVAEFTGIDNKWITDTSPSPHRHKVARGHYEYDSDHIVSISYPAVAPQKDKSMFEVGVEMLYCFECGEPHSKDEHGMTNQCFNCNDCSTGAHKKKKIKVAV